MGAGGPLDGQLAGASIAASGAEIRQQQELTRKSPAHALSSGTTTFLPDTCIGVEVDCRVTYWNWTPERLYGFNAPQGIGGR